MNEWLKRIGTIKYSVEIACIKTIISPFFNNFRLSYFSEFIEIFFLVNCLQL